MGACIVAAIAFDEDRDLKLHGLGAGHLFAVNMTRLAFRKGAFLRNHVYSFIETFAPPLTRKVVEMATNSETANQFDI